MQLPDFNYTTCKWDDWRAMHHVYSHNFVQFDTGELIATRWYVRDRYRCGHGRELGLTVMVSDDITRGSLNTNNRVLKTPDGDKILQSWFQSSKGFVYDESAHMLVQTGHIGDNPNVPTRFHSRAAAYWAGPGREPIGAPIRLTKPRKRTPEEKEKANDLRALAKAWRTLTDEGKQWNYFKTNRPAVLSDYIDRDFESLNDIVKLKIAEEGFTGPFETITVPYVRVENV